MIPKKPSILFITWDGPQTNYLENLFFPIFEGLEDWQFHVLQFSWAGEAKQEQLKTLAKKMGIRYTHMSVIRKPHPVLGTLITLTKGIRFLTTYVRTHHIEVLMPRSTFPAMMAKASKHNYPELQIVFDADGLPLEERVDFNGLNPKGRQYRFLKKQERRMLRLADRILARSQHAIHLHLQAIGEQHSTKFYKVTNGRDEDFFSLDPALRKTFREKLGLADDELLMVYTGSLGPQYGWEIMVAIFQKILASRPGSKLLILTGDENQLQDQLPPNITVISGQYKEVPAWLNAGDLALAIRQPLPSMKGVAPIKLGEYLLMGLPTIASKGIGDSEALLEDFPYVYLFDHDHKDETKKAAAWALGQTAIDKKAIRRFGLQHFGLKRALRDYGNALDGLRRRDEG